MSIRKNFPLAYCFGERQVAMTQEELIQATPNVRLQSVWPALASRVVAFQKTLTVAEQAAFDIEDTLSELAIVLLERDGEWDPDRGKYITYAMTMVNHTLYAIRDKTKVVHPPRNSSARMKKYDAEDGSGVDTGRKRKTANDIRRASRGAATLDIDGHENGYGGTTEPIVYPDPDALEAHEASEANREEIKKAIKQLAPLEARVIGRLFGLWGQPQVNEHLLGIELGYEEVEIRKIRARGMAKMRKYLTGGSQ